MKLESYGFALSDANKALELDKSYIKVSHHNIKVYIKISHYMLRHILRYLKAYIKVSHYVFLKGNRNYMYIIIFTYFT